MQLNINTNAAVRFTAILEKMGRSALPNAIRSTLNRAVYDVKKNTLQTEVDEAFEKRQPNFFKANSKFENAKGFNVSTMKATIGMVEGGLKGSSNHAVKDLEQQEHGGSINKKTFIPLPAARLSNNKNKNVRANARLSAIKNIIDPKNASGKNQGQRFIKSAVFAGVGGYVLGKKILWRVNSLNRTEDGNFKLTAVYSFKKGRSVSVAATSFMKKASVHSADKMDYFYELEAQREIQKLK